MSTPDLGTDRHRPRTHWGLPIFGVCIGVCYLVAGWLGGNLEFGVFGLLLMTAVSAVLVLASRRSETVAGLMNRRDERINDIDLRATTFSGMSVFAAVLAMFMIEIAQGQDGSPYYQLAALGGVGYIVAVGYLRFRR